MDGYASIQTCIAKNMNTSTSTDTFPDLQLYVNFCLQGSQNTSSATQATSAPSVTTVSVITISQSSLSLDSSANSVASVLGSYASYASSVSMSESSTSWCLFYSISYGSMAMNCTSCKKGDRLKCWLTDRSSRCHDCSLDYGHQHSSPWCSDLSSTEWSHLFPA